MSELYQFITKITSHFDGISCRKVYGKDAIYYKELPIIVITDERVAIKVTALNDLPMLRPIVTQWVLDENPMDDWYLLPASFNKKKNKLIPAIEQVIELIQRPKIKNRIRKKKKKKTQTQKKIKEAKLPQKKKGIIHTLFSFIKNR
ncbi:MAG: hypothetical protein KAG61_05365 [Bacteriovoracaceae bacterium]|nr:hypothetical protein [Bacteriovoracaceae bacterium]